MHGYFDATSLARGQSLKFWNAVTACLCGGIPAVLYARFGHHGAWWLWPVGLVAGFLWGNAFEYAYHRWLLHLPRSSFGMRHLLHHSTVGEPNEPEHVTLGGSPFWIVVLFLVNGIPATLIESFAHTGAAAGLFLGFVAYVIVVEDVHWRIHVGAWMPRFLEPARRFHLVHHDYADQNFSVFLPIFDKLLRTTH